MTLKSALRHPDGQSLGFALLFPALIGIGYLIDGSAPDMPWARMTYAAAFGLLLPDVLMTSQYAAAKRESYGRLMFSVYLGGAMAIIFFLINLTEPTASIMDAQTPAITGLTYGALSVLWARKPAPELIEIVETHYQTGPEGQKAGPLKRLWPVVWIGLPAAMLIEGVLSTTYLLFQMILLYTLLPLYHRAKTTPAFLATGTRLTGAALLIAGMYLFTD